MFDVVTHMMRGYISSVLTERSLIHSQSELLHKSGKKKAGVRGPANYGKVEQCKSNGRNQTKTWEIKPRTLR